MKKETHKENARRKVDDNLGKLVDVLLARITYDSKVANRVSYAGSIEEARVIMDEMPEREKMAIDEVQFKHWGKDADHFTVTVRLADREKAVNTLRDIVISLLKGSV